MPNPVESLDIKGTHLYKHELDITLRLQIIALSHYCKQMSNNMDERCTI